MNIFARSLCILITAGTALVVSACDTPETKPPEPAIFTSGEDFNFTLGKGNSEIEVEIKAKHFEQRLHITATFSPRAKDLKADKFSSLLLQQGRELLSSNHGHYLNSIDVVFKDRDGFVLCRFPLLKKNDVGFNVEASSSEKKNALQFSGSMSLEKTTAERIEKCSLGTTFTAELTTFLEASN